MNDLRVLVVARDQLARAGLAAILDQQPGCAVVGQAGLDMGPGYGLEAYRPDVVVWDLAPDPSAALEDLAGLPEDSPPVMALVSNDSHAAAAWAAGARALLLRDTDPGRLFPALVALAHGFAVLDQTLAAVSLPLRHLPSGPVPELTPRELETLSLLAEGLPNKAIASRMGISEHTVKFHVNSILGKLGSQSRTEAVARATRLGLVLL